MHAYLLQGHARSHATLHAHSLLQVIQAEATLPEVGANARVLQQRSVKGLQ